jgi:NAD(P)-dependent dehydrogenase (short-subunit alcohol dehydrogenase family)
VPDLDQAAGQTILVTGATDGLGQALATSLARAGARVHAHGRDANKLAELHSETGVETLQADLAELRQVRDLAHAARNAAGGRLNVLVNNAGIGTTLPGGDDARHESADGIELRFAVNYLAGYLLTRELLDAIDHRIVFVASAGQMPIDFDDPMLVRDYSGVRAYCQSKLAQIMYAFDLAENELRDGPVTATALHPATFMPTNMVRHAGTTPASSLEEGAEATLRLIADPALDGVTGAYFNGTRRTDPDPQALDPDARRRLRELSEELVGTPA